MYILSTSVPSELLSSLAVEDSVLPELAPCVVVVVVVTGVVLADVVVVVVTVGAVVVVAAVVTAGVVDVLEELVLTLETPTMELSTVCPEPYSRYSPAIAPTKPAL
jgi:hypothetical protein